AVLRAGVVDGRGARRPPARARGAAGRGVPRHRLPRQADRLDHPHRPGPRAPGRPPVEGGAGRGPAAAAERRRRRRRTGPGGPAQADRPGRARGHRARRARGRRDRARRRAPRRRAPGPAGRRGADPVIGSRRSRRYGALRPLPSPTGPGTLTGSTPANGGEMITTTREARPSDPVRLVMTRVVATVPAWRSLRDVARELAADEVSTVLVAEGGRTVGLISERDVVRAVAAGWSLDDAQTVDVMTAELVWADPDDTISDTASLMLDAGIRHVPVGDSGQAVGVVSARDV